MDNFATELMELCLRYNVTLVLTPDNKIEFRSTNLNLYKQILAIMSAKQTTARLDRRKIK